MKIKFINNWRYGAGRTDGSTAWTFVVFSVWRNDMVVKDRYSWDRWDRKEYRFGLPALVIHDAGLCILNFMWTVSW